MIKKIGTILIIFTVILTIGYIILTFKVRNEQNQKQILDVDILEQEADISFFTEEDFKEMYDEEELQREADLKIPKYEKLKNSQSTIGLDNVILCLIQGADWELDKDVSELKGPAAFTIGSKLTDHFIEKFRENEHSGIFFEDQISKNNVTDVLVWNDSYNFYTTVEFQMLPEQYDTAIYTLKLDKEGKIDDFIKIYNSFEAEYTPIFIGSDIIDYLYLAYDNPTNRLKFYSDTIDFSCPCEFKKIFGSDKFNKDNIYEIGLWSNADGESYDDNLGTTNHWANFVVRIAEDDGYFWKYQYTTAYTTGENLCLTGIEAKFVKKLRGSKIEKESTTNEEVVEDEE